MIHITKRRGTHLESLSIRSIVAAHLRCDLGEVEVDDTGSVWDATTDRDDCLKDAVDCRCAIEALSSF